MRFEELITTAKHAILAGEFICFFARCTINYSGRAESVLDEGDRLIMIKQDRSLLIHQPAGGMPINYLKAPAKVTFDLRKDEETEEPILEMHARSGHDEIDVRILRVYDFFSRRLVDGQSQELSGNEAEMSDHIKNNPDLISLDFKPVSREEHTKYGFIDVFGHLGDGTLAIVECKRYTAGLSAVTQLRRYVEKMKSLKGIEKVTGIIAAPGITQNAQKMLEDWGLSHVRVEPPKRHMRLRKEQKKIDSFFG
ncbi:MAG: endonuclease NucS domain-containing protein [Candidatus Woesearchaeota archaeon]